MRMRLLEWLACPQCRTRLRLDAPAGDEDVEQGTLVCAGGHRVAVAGGVPRFAPPPDAIQRRTREAFGYEWTAYADYDVENFRSLVLPEPETFFAGALGLDVGCGAGRHLLAAAQAGAEMVGVDQSRSVEAVRARLHAMPNAHVVEADLRELPFAPGTFDFLYSWGVLHHTPDPEAAFRAVLPMLKPGGLAVIGVYQATLRKRWLEGARVVTTRLPLPVARALARGCAVVDYYGCIVPYRWLRRIGLGRFAPSHIREYARYGFHVCETDWFDRLTAPITHWYTRQDILGWFQRAGLTDVRVEAIGDFWWRGQGRLP